MIAEPYMLSAGTSISLPLATRWALWRPVMLDVEDEVDLDLLVATGFIDLVELKVGSVKPFGVLGS